MSRPELFCNDWEFSKQPYGTAYDENFSFKRVDIPHDYLIYDVNNLYETSTGWYRKKFVYSKKENVITSIRFEGVYMDSAVYCNGKLAGEWKYGYSTFEFDLTDLIKDGENVITVAVNYRSPNTRWYSGAGIFRKVYLRETQTSYICPDGVYVSTEKAGDDFKVTVSTECARPQGVNLEGYDIRTSVIDNSGKTVFSLTSKCDAADKSCIDELVIRDNTSYSVNTQIFTVEKPVLWDVEQGNLYTLKSELLVDEEVVDETQCRIGFRTIEFTCDKGFFINGRHVKLHGCCEHHDLGALGAAVNKTAIRRKLTKLREMGINAIRTSHNMPAVEFMDLADEMGFLILSEGFDMWERSKTDYDYARFFKEWIEKDVASWIRRDRNHPSVIGWSIGNEIYDTHADDRGQEVTSKLVRLVRLHDSRHNGCITIGSNYMIGDNARKCADIVKLAGYNYGERFYEQQHKEHPDWMIYGSETASVIQSRGIYHFPLSQPSLVEDDEQCSSIGNCATAWGAKNTESCIIPDRDAEYCAGQFIWTGFDYIGEPTPYSTKNSYFGQIDTAGFRKDSSYVFQSEWTDYKQKPCIHIFPHWDFNENQKIDVRVTTNAPELELFFNGKSLGRKHIDHLHGTTLTGDYILAYEKGTLKACAYDENGNVIAEDEVRSFGNCSQLMLTQDKSVMKADGEDLIFLEISALDEAGTFVANANNRVNVQVTGAGRLVGLDNGDSTDYDQYKTTSRRLFSGKLLAIIASKTTAGDIDVTVSSQGLETKHLKLSSQKSGFDKGVSASDECTLQENDCKTQDDIPVRNIILSAEKSVLDNENPETKVRVCVLPENSSYKDNVEYRLTTDSGIDVKNAKIIFSDSGEVTIKALGDGQFNLRAICKNGTEKYHIISSLPLTASGLGSITVNPYEKVVAGLHTVDSGDIVSGIERGASFSFEKSWFGFENVDFGMAGSDKITISVYANMTTATTLSIYDGIPEQGGECLGTFEYLKEPVWLTYIPETYKLNKKLKGIHTLVIEGTQSVSVRDFVFEANKKEFSDIDAVDNLSIYGDKYTVEKDAVTGIGNNVVLSFGEFDFTEEKPSEIIICGKSNLAVNSINLCFDNGETTRKLVEFDGCDEYTERSFKLDGVSGKYNLSFTFLPGTDFDFKYFRFNK